MKAAWQIFITRLLPLLNNCFMITAGQCQLVRVKSGGMGFRTFGILQPAFML